METQWAEQQLNVPERGLRKFFGKVLNTIYSADVRDKYRIRLAYGIEENTTEVYLTHQGAKEVAVGEDFRWQARPSEPALEMEMLNRLMVFLGLEKETAETLLAQTQVTNPTQPTQPVEVEEATSPGSPLAVITRTQDGQISLLLQEEVERAWRRVGFALDRAKFTLADRDRQERIYYIRYIDPDSQSKSGFLSYFFGGDSDEDKAPEYRIKLIPEFDSTRIVILSNQNKAAPSATAEKILVVLEEQLK
jgi:outer membrane protein assembly factor BamC